MADIPLPNSPLISTGAEYLQQLELLYGLISRAHEPKLRPNEFSAKWTIRKCKGYLQRQSRHYPNRRYTSRHKAGRLASFPCSPYQKMEYQERRSRYPPVQWKHNTMWKTKVLAHSPTHSCTRGTNGSRCCSRAYAGSDCPSACGTVALKWVRIYRILLGNEIIVVIDVNHCVIGESHFEEIKDVYLLAERRYCSPHWLPKSY